MPGYHLLEEDMLQSRRPDGIMPHANRMAFLDYMRELREDTFPFPQGHRLLVYGLEDVLLASGPKLPEVEAMIRTVLSARANELNSVMGTNVQILFRDHLRRADDFWLEAGINRHLSLRRIFGTPSRQPGPNGTEFFYVGFNLT